MKPSFYIVTAIAFCSLFVLFSCGKDFKPPADNNVIDTSRLLKEYTIYNPGVFPDSLKGVISYDTINRTIILKQYSGIIAYPVHSWKYVYNAGGYLTDVYDIEGGEPGVNFASIVYDQNMEIESVTYTINSVVTHVPYTTNLASNGKEIIFYDTTSGFYGSRNGIGKIVYNNKGQLIHRFLTKTKPNSAYFDTVQFKSVFHEILSYDAADNLALYQAYVYEGQGNGNGPPADINRETYSQHDNSGNEFYEFEEILLKGINNKIPGISIDPLTVWIAGTTWFFQNIKYPPLQANIRSQYNYSSHSWVYSSFTNQPIYDSTGRLIKTTLFSSDPGVGPSDIYLHY